MYVMDSVDSKIERPTQLLTLRRIQVILRKWFIENTTIFIARKASSY